METVLNVIIKTVWQWLTSFGIPKWPVLMLPKLKCIISSSRRRIPLALDHLVSLIRPDVMHRVAVNKGEFQYEILWSKRVARFSIFTELSSFLIFPCNFWFHYVFSNKHWKFYDRSDIIQLTARWYRTIWSCSFSVKLLLILRRYDKLSTILTQHWDRTQKTCYLPSGWSVS